jgi:hypothetical protein
MGIALEREGNFMEGSSSPWDTYIESFAEALKLAVDPAWKETVRANVETIFKMAAAVEAFELPGDAEPAPVFEA